MLPRGSYLYFLAILSLLKLSSGEEERLDSIEVDSDAVIKKVLGDTPFEHRKKPNQEDVEKFSGDISYFAEEMTPNLTEPKELLSGPDLIVSVMKNKLRMLLNRDNNRVKDLINNVDGFQKLTDTYDDLIKNTSTINGRRFADTYNTFLDEMMYDAQEIVEQLMINKDNNSQSLRPSLRAWYNPNRWPYPLPALVGQDSVTLSSHAIIRLRNNTIKNMFIHMYRTQYSVALAQKMRWRYYDHPSYKLGFSFCLLRQLFKEMKILLRAFEYSYLSLKRWNGKLLSWVLFTYGKVQRLARDSRDIRHHIHDMEYARKQLLDPQYYEFFPSSTGRYSG